MIALAQVLNSKSLQLYAMNTEKPVRGSYLPTVATCRLCDYPCPPRGGIWVGVFRLRKVGLFTLFVALWRISPSHRPNSNLVAGTGW